VADGDSITAGQGAPNPYTNLVTLTPGHWDIRNVAVVGEQLGHMVTAAPTVVDPLFTPGMKNVVVIWGGTNDFAQGQTVAAVESLLMQYCSGRKAVGFRCIVATMLSRVGNNPVGGETLDADKNAYNTWMKANWPSFADGIADFTGTTLGCDGCYANPTWFQNDEIHPTIPGIATLEAPIISAAVDALP
jgi:lysophospholipase L1-like esterase